MINLNGSISPKTKALFYSGNRAFLYGDQIFETIHFYNGKLLFASILNAFNPTLFAA